MTGKSVPFERFREQWQRQLVADRKLSAGDLRIGIAISWHMNRNTQRAWPGLNTLARVTGMSRRTCIRAIKQLGARRHLRILRTRVGSKNGVNHYVPIVRHVHEMTPTSDTADTQVVSRMSPKPLREPPMEPLPYGRDLVSRHPNGLNTNEEKRVGEEERTFASLTTSPDILTECYLRAREKFGEPGAGVVAKAARIDLVPAEEIFEAIEDATDVQEFAYVLWRP